MLVTRPVEVLPEVGRVAAGGGVGTARVSVLIVTWNRREFVSTVLRQLSRQTYPSDLLDVIVIDNAGTDGTLEHLIASFNPERVVDNPTARAHEPKFQPPRARASDAGNTLGFASLSVVRNSDNHGGCGGFNTGFAFVEQCSVRRPDYLWLVDDDAELDDRTLEHLSRVMSADGSIGLVGSRTVDIRDRSRTIETTIYYDTQHGVMRDDAPEHHPRHVEHVRWAQRVGGTRGDNHYTGQMDVDVVSACSMLARWDAVVGGVGFWDARYFIYCDDADWCLRFAKAGWRVVLSLDAVVFHTPWNLKLTPARIYYANRNRIWMAQKALPAERLKPVIRRTLLSILKDALRACWMRRTFHAGIILDTARDAVIGRAGKTGSDGPPAEPVVDALVRLGGLERGATIGVMCSQPESLKWMGDLRAHVESACAQRGRNVSGVRWLAIVRNDVPGDVPAGSVVYGGRWASRLKKQVRLMIERPTLCVVFEQTNDLPILSPLGPGHNVHIDLKKPTMAQVERDGWAQRGRFMARWMVEAVRCMWFAQRIKPFVRAGKYG